MLPTPPATLRFCCCLSAAATASHLPSTSAYSCSELPPTDTEAYLVGCLPGVGPKTAALLVAGLGDGDVRQALSSRDALSKLVGIKGIGVKKAAEIKAAWDKNTGGVCGGGVCVWMQQVLGSCFL